MRYKENEGYRNTQIHRDPNKIRGMMTMERTNKDGIWEEKLNLKPTNEDKI